MCRFIGQAVCCLLLLVAFTCCTVRAWSSQSSYQLDVRSRDGSPIQAAVPAILCMDVSDGSGHSLLHPLRLHQQHSRLLHIVLVPATYSAVLHVHIEDYPAFFYANPTSDRCTAINVTLPSAGRWVVGVHLWPVDEPSMVTVSVVVDVAGGPVVADFPIDTRSLQVVQPLPLQHGQAYTAAVQRATASALSSRSVVVDVRLDNDHRPVAAGVCCPLALSVSDATTREPIDDLLPLLSLPAHLFLFHYNSSTNEYHFHHLHARAAHQSAVLSCSAGGVHDMTAMAGMKHMAGMDRDGVSVDEKFGPWVEAAGVRFDCPGRWLVIGQLRRASAANDSSNGELLTVTMDVRVG